MQKLGALLRSCISVSNLNFFVLSDLLFLSCCACLGGGHRTASNVMCERCCAKQCLFFGHNYDKEMVKDCIEELIHLRKRMSQNEKRTYLMGLVRSLYSKVVSII